MHLVAINGVAELLLEDLVVHEDKDQLLSVLIVVAKDNVKHLCSGLNGPSDSGGDALGDLR